MTISRMAGAGVALALAVCGCTGAGEAVPRDEVLVRSVPIEDLEVGLAALGESDRELVTSFAATVPETIPDHAVALAAFIEGSGADTPDGIAETPRVILANIGSTSFDVSVVCLIAWSQAPCDTTADVPHASFHGPGLVVADAGLADGLDARRDVLILIDGDDARPMPASWALDTRQPGTSARPTAKRLDPIPPVFGGCGFITLIQSLEPRDTFRPLGTLDRDAPLYLLIQTCADQPSEELVLLPIGDRTTALEQSDLWATVVHVEPGAHAIEIDRTLIDDVTELQILAIRLDQPGTPSWATHAVHTTE